jgi:hypothetical protein
LSRESPGTAESPSACAGGRARRAHGEGGDHLAETADEPGCAVGKLHHLGATTADGLHMALSRPRRDALASSSRGVFGHVLAAGDSVSVRVYLHVLGRARPVRLELSATGQNNSVDFDRDDREVVAV